MQQLWADALKMPLAQISLNDNFMRLGGDSIAAMRLASAARARGFPLSTGTVFQHPTLEAMSDVAEALTASQQQRQLSFEPFSDVESIMPKTNFSMKLYSHKSGSPNPRSRMYCGRPISKPWLLVAA